MNIDDRKVIAELRDISKHFYGVKALENVSMALREGEIHALVGENGAGKSTLMKILIGMYQPDSGQIVLDGEEVTFNSALDTRNKGISMIFQEFMQVKHMKVMENIFLGREPKNRFGSIDFNAMKKETIRILDHLNLDIDPEAYMYQLTVAKHQLIEIAKAVAFDARIIIMDEPTSALSQQEINNLLKIVLELKNEGRSIIFISHKMEEIYSICERVTILRDGHLIHTGKVSEIEEREMIRMMVDRDVSSLFPKMEAEIGETILSVRHLTRKGEFDDISFDLRKGEILGIGGLMGAGRTELVQCIMGVTKPDSGSIFLNGRKVVHKEPYYAVKNKMVLITEDRKNTGLILKLSVRDNVLLSSLNKCMKHGYLNKQLEGKSVKTYTQKLEIKTRNEYTICADLSGGNQQKVAIAKALNAEPDIIILDEPTRGIDVKTKSDIHRIISELACQGKAIIMVSSELPELMGMSDRIIVLHEGDYTGQLDRIDFTSEKIMTLAVGTKVEEVVNE